MFYMAPSLVSSGDCGKDSADERACNPTSKSSNGYSRALCVRWTSNARRGRACAIAHKLLFQKTIRFLRRIATDKRASVLRGDGRQDVPSLAASDGEVPIRVAAVGTLGAALHLAGKVKGLGGDHLFDQQALGGGGGLVIGGWLRCGVRKAE